MCHLHKTYCFSPSYTSHLTLVLYYCIVIYLISTTILSRHKSDVMLNDKFTGLFERIPKSNLTLKVF